MQKKIFVIFTLILLVSTLLTGFLSLSLITNNYTNELEQRLISNAQLIEGVINENKELANTAELQRLSEDLGNKIDARITIIDKNGEVLADTLPNTLPAQNHGNRPEVRKAMDGEIGREIRYSSTVKEDMLYVALPSHLEAENIAVIRLSMDLAERNKINQRLFYYTGASILFSLVAALLLGYRFIGKLMEPIKQIIEASKKISNGKFDRRVKVQSSDEIGELANHFNHMADHLENTIVQLSDSNTKFKALLTSMINPIIAIDNNQHIILFNQSAEYLFKVNTNDVLGKDILEVINKYSLDRQLIEVFNNNKSRIEISINYPEKKVLKIHTNPIQLDHDPIRTLGTVALIEDITEIRRLEKMRSDFVTNVSHELKTPLTSISGFVETLKAGAVEDEEVTRRFLDIIEIETDRLKRLINDILTLSEIENIETNLITHEIFPGDTLKEVADVITPIANSKEIELHTEVDLNLPTIYGNRDWFKQLIINLLDNAIKYTPPGGKVQLIAYKKYNNIIIIVKDTGIGIPKKDISRLFERFYRVDKARSRKVGGTGLGLAIVKHIVLSLNGRIKVNSEEGKGTEFTVIIPVNKEI